MPACARPPIAPPQCPCPSLQPGRLARLLFSRFLARRFRTHRPRHADRTKPYRVQRPLESCAYPRELAASISSSRPKGPMEKISRPEQSSAAPPPPPLAANSPTPPSADTQQGPGLFASSVASFLDSVARPCLAPILLTHFVRERARPDPGTTKAREDSTSPAPGVHPAA